MDIPIIQTPRLGLRGFRQDDAFPLFEILQEDGILSYFPTQSAPDFDRVEQMIQRQLDHWKIHGYGWWAVTLLETDELIGWNGLQFLPETEEVEIGYLLAKSFWGQGLATEGGLVGIRYGFETLELERIIGLVHPDNSASQRVLEKLGLDFVDRVEYFGMELLRYWVDKEN